MIKEQPRLTTPTKLTSSDKFEVSNKFIEARFTHLSPNTVTAKAWKFIICAIAAFQKTEACKSFINEMWNKYAYENNLHVRDGVHCAFESASSRRVTLRMQDVANICTYIDISDEKKLNINSKKFNRSDIEATCRTAGALHITTNTTLNCIEDWSAYRTATLSDNNIALDSPLTDWVDWHGTDDYDFTGFIFESVDFVNEKPLVTVQFSINFIKEILAIEHYTKYDLGHLSKFKSLAALRLYQCLIERKGKIKNANVTVNQNINWWRSFVGVADTLQVIITKDIVQSKLGKRTLWALSLPSGIKTINDIDTLEMFYKQLDEKQQHAITDSCAIIEKQLDTITNGSKDIDYTILIEHSEGKYQAFKKFNQNVLKKALVEVYNYCSSSRETKNAINISSQASSLKINKIRMGSKRKKGASSTTSFWVTFEMEANSAS
ncbi:RepB family plasmid replication initiator protein [Vibrio parahaemolyticus]|nr:RepB family plasmid replication initiator protein [Vibrio parahaemolyticus]HCE2124832.1 RepB family plasmid replication initiator protein [Vibrio parahaemolyticus]